MTPKEAVASVALVGCGSLGSIAAKEIHAGKAGPYRLVAVLDEPFPAKAQQLAQHCGAVACADFAQLLGHKADYIIEAATGDVLKKIALPALQSGAHVIALSAGALCDAVFAADLRAAASEAGRKVYMVSGAIGGFDIAQAALQTGKLSVTVVNEKPPRALAGAPVLHGELLPEDRVVEVFRGTAREAMALFPQNVNVVAAMSFATLGVDAVTTTVISNPALINNSHTIFLEGDFGTARLEIVSGPCPDNPKSSMVAAYSVTALLKKLADPIQF